MKTYVFIDESGTLPDPKDAVIVVAAVGTTKPEKLIGINKQVREKGRYRRKYGELKFYTAGERTKSVFFKKLAEAGVDVFVLIVDKLGRKIPDTPQHFAILCWLLLSDVLSFYSKVDEIFLDRHFHREEDLGEFNKILLQLLGGLLPIKHVDSQKEKRVNSADMIAGAVLAKETGKNDKFYQGFKARIISETRINWPEAKRRLLANKKIA